ncbi:DUF6010 family protein [Actinomadura sp. ATCC 31491]|uniref:DUF6010 family protein n=1 Tax=Actinomadura luzonensis TaxID=2805427 RepID=A0ABT0FT06_9ACTN|nr:DUF6010 family protein [Actinomadura luzonensis]MCK2215465.1 DUF6010 family protein [Actinomadura luzonensis]
MSSAVSIAISLAVSILMPIVIGIVAVCLLSLIPEPHRRRFNAVLVAGAGAAYLSGGGLGPAELALPAVMTYVAYRGLDSWAWIGAGWLLHTAWTSCTTSKAAPSCRSPSTPPSAAPCATP